MAITANKYDYIKYSDTISDPDFILHDTVNLDSNSNCRLIDIFGFG